MTNVWSTAGLSGAHAFRRWRSIADELLGCDLPRTRVPDGFFGSMRFSLAGAAALFEIRSEGVDYEVARNRERVAREHADSVGVMVKLTSGGRLRQPGVEVEYRAGDAVIMDGAEPMSHTSGLSAHDLVIVIPREAMDRHLLPGERLVLDPRVIPPSPLRDVAVDHLTSLARHLPDLEPAWVARASGLVVDMFAALLAKGAARAADSRAAASALRRRILATIEECLEDPALSPATLAARHHISLRYLHALFQDGESVARSILARRLERARAFLESRAAGRLAIREVAYRHGFISSPHFCRAFKARFGVTPSEVRRST